MITLGIETSCDETAICLLETKLHDDGSTECRIIENLIHSQADLHAKYGGVFPMMAKREHQKNLPILAEKILGTGEEKIKSGALKIDRIAVTQGPGLEPALWAGIDYAKKLGEELKIPVVGVNHMLGHVLGSLLNSSAPDNSFAKLKTPALPALALLISGGHTELVLVNNLNLGEKSSFEVVGRTKDDAVGEAFDKVARLLGLPYPGGQHVSELAEQARKDPSSPNSVRLPRPMLHSPDLDFSFSGLKTAVLYEIRKTDENATMKPEKNSADNVPGHGLSEIMKKEIAREFEDAVTEVLVKKTSKAIEKYGVQSLIAGGGVIANKNIRGALEKLAHENSISLFLPPEGVSGDNALMIALAGALLPELPEKNASGESPIKAAGNLSF